MTPIWNPRGGSPALEERERIRLAFREALKLYDGDDVKLRQFVRGFVNFNGPPGAELVGLRPGKAS